MSYELRAWLEAFLFTELVEIPFYVLGLGCSLPAAFGASALTHPIVWFGFFTRRVSAPYVARVVSAELFAWLGEATYFRFLVRRGRRRRDGERPVLTLPRTLTWALLANGASVGLGFLSRHLFGAP